jgi:hypothetical protein
MSILEKKSQRKAKAIRLLVETGEYSIAYAIMLAEELNDSGKLLDVDYEPLVEWLEEKLEPVVEEPIEETPEEEIEENIENV